MAEAERRVPIGVASVDGGDARVVPVRPGILRQEQRAPKRDRLYERGDDENRRERGPRTPQEDQRGDIREEGGADREVVGVDARV